MATRPKYPGKLGRPIRKADVLPALLAEVDGEKDAALRWLEEERQYRLFDLLYHYGIELKEGCWFRLAWQLAFDHVPGFKVSGTPGPGRPRNLQEPPVLDNLQAAAKRRGPATKWDRAMCVFLLAVLELGRRRLEENGERVTNVAAIGLIVRHKYPGKNMSWCRQVAEDLAKRVSECRRTLRNFESNSG